MTGNALAGDKLRRWREAEKLSQAQFAEIVDVEQAWISRIEAGVSMPSVSLMWRLEEATKGAITLELFAAMPKSPTPELYCPVCGRRGGLIDSATDERYMDCASCGRPRVIEVQRATEAREIQGNLRIEPQDGARGGPHEEAGAGHRLRPAAARREEKAQAG